MSEEYATPPARLQKKQRPGGKTRERSPTQRTIRKAREPFPSAGYESSSTSSFSDSGTDNSDFSSRSASDSDTEESSSDRSRHAWNCRHSCYHSRAAVHPVHFFILIFVCVLECTAQRSNRLEGAADLQRRGLHHHHRRHPSPMVSASSQRGEEGSPASSPLGLSGSKTGTQGKKRNLFAASVAVRAQSLSCRSFLTRKVGHEL